MGIFKSYDIRAVWGRDWDARMAYRIGFHLPRLLGARRLVIGRDARLSSPELRDALSDGICDAGCDVADIGPCTTPLLYFATAHHGFDGSAMITASHNPPEYNGLKVSRAQAVPVGYGTGLEVLERMVTEEPRPASRRGQPSSLDPLPEYFLHLRRFASDSSGVTLVADCSDGMAGPELMAATAPTRARVIPMHDVPDGRFPHHPPNPLEESNLAMLRERVRAEKADLGVCFDGDADRAVFVDELGSAVSPDLITAVLARRFFSPGDLRAEPGSAVLYDVRSSRAVVEEIERLGGRPVMCRVGHSHAKKLLRETGGIMGGELAGHYYFRDNYFCDSGMIALLVLLAVRSREAAPLSRIVGGIRRYHSSGEMNFVIRDREEVMRRLRDDYRGGRLTELDGIRVDYPSWWYNVRPSNTEPYLRLVVEAASAEELRMRTAELRAKIEGGPLRPQAE